MFARCTNGAVRTRARSSRALSTLGPIFILLNLVPLLLVPSLALAGEQDPAGPRQGIEASLAAFPDLKEDQDHTFELDVIGIQHDVAAKFLFRWDFGDPQADTGNPDTIMGQGLFTGKIRSAEIELEQGGVRGRKTDLGFVPLLHLAGDWRFAEDWRLSLDVDGSWAPQGRAIDASLKAWWAVRDDVELGFGYRTIEGGADNDEVYTFAWVHQAVVSMRVTF